MGRMEKMISRWFMEIKNKDVYITAAIAELVAFAVLISVGALILIPSIALFNLGIYGKVLAGLLVLIGLVAYIYLAQIVPGAIIRKMENENSGYLEVVLYAIKNKIWDMGTAVIFYDVIMLATLIITFVPLILGFIHMNMLLIVIGLLVMLAGLLALVLIAYFMWVTPVVAYMEEPSGHKQSSFWGRVVSKWRNVYALRDSYRIMRKSGWSGTGFLFIVTIVIMGVTYIGEAIGEIMTAHLIPTIIPTMSLEALLSSVASSIGWAIIIWVVVTYIITVVQQALHTTAQVTIYREVKGGNKKETKRVNRAAKNSTKTKALKTTVKTAAKTRKAKKTRRAGTRAKRLKPKNE